MIRAHAEAEKNINIVVDDNRRLHTIMVEVKDMIDLVEIKQELEKMAKRLADIRGSL